MTAARYALVLALPLAAACSSWDTGSSKDDAGEIACKDTIEAFSRAAERCGRDYKTSYDFFLVRDANGDCKNVRTVRDETALRGTCLPLVMAMDCADVLNGQTDPSCTKQLQRTASFRPALH